MNSSQARRLFVIPSLVAVLGFCAPARSGDLEKRITRLMRTQIQVDIKAKGQAFAGPDVIPSAFLKALEGKRLVGLGESSHGTSEIQIFHAKVILAMAKKGRVLVFLEEPYGGVARINQWVQGEGDDAELLILMKTPGLLYGVHQTQEYANFFRSVRAFNAMNPAGSKIEIYGVDSVMAAGPTDVTPALQSFSLANNLNLAAEIASCSTLINDPSASTPVVRATALGAAAKILASISTIDPGISGQVEAETMANALAHYVQTDVASNNTFGSVCIDIAHGTPSSPISDSSRDAGMAENIKLLMDRKIPKGGMAVYWAHNAHVGRISMLNADPTGFLSTWSNTGCILNLWLNDAYLPLVSMTGKGSFRAHIINADGSTTPFQAVTAPAVIHQDSLNSIATAVSPTKPVFFLTANMSLLGFTRPEFYVAGAFEMTVPETWFVKTIPGLAYGGVTSFPVSTAAQNLP